MPKAPPGGQGAEWDQYLEDVARVPLVVYERETWTCELVEVPRTLTDEFFVLPTPAGAKIIDRDREDLIEEYSLGLPVNEFSEVGTFLGKAWLLGPLSVMPDLSKDGGVGEVPQKASSPVGQNEEAPKADADVELDKVVWWGEAVDGLEPGFWLTKSEDPRNLRIPMNSLVNYRVVVRNTMDKEIEFLVRLLPFGSKDVPYLIPSDKLDSKGKITPPQPAKEFQTQGAAKNCLGSTRSRPSRWMRGNRYCSPSVDCTWESSRRAIPADRGLCAWNSLDRPAAVGASPRLQRAGRVCSLGREGLSHQDCS